jgi:hypothetical protein
MRSAPSHTRVCIRRFDGWKLKAATLPASWDRQCGGLRRDFACSSMDKCQALLTKLTSTTKAMARLQTRRCIS